MTRHDYAKRYETERDAWLKQSRYEAITIWLSGALCAASAVLFFIVASS